MLAGRKSTYSNKLHTTSNRTSKSTVLCDTAPAASSPESATTELRWSRAGFKSLCVRGCTSIAKTQAAIFFRFISSGCGAPGSWPGGRGLESRMNFKLCLERKMILWARQESRKNLISLLRPLPVPIPDIFRVLLECVRAPGSPCLNSGDRLRIVGRRGAHSNRSYLSGMPGYACRDSLQRIKKMPTAIPGFDSLSLSWHDRTNRSSIGANGSDVPAS